MSARVVDTGAVGTIVVHDPTDLDLTFKLQFPDGSCNWFPASAVEIEGEVAPTSPDQAAELGIHMGPTGAGGAAAETSRGPAAETSRAGEVGAGPAPEVEILASQVQAETASVLVRVVPPVGDGRTPSNIVCVIDVSGSMRAEATIQADGGVTESNGLTMLDIARHGIRTVIETLGPQDRLAVVWFNHGADTLFGLTEMTDEGKKEASKKLDQLEENGGTNIWLGLRQGLEELRRAEEPGATPRLSHVMLLTDGCTTNRDTVVSNLQAYQREYERLPGTISTFGFGYNIDSPLLCDLASAGDATYSFIPDAGFVGTVFVNTMSNLLTTMAREVFLELEPCGGSVIKSADGQCRLENKADGAKRVALGTLQYGQSRDVCLSMKVDSKPGEPFLEASVAYEVLGCGRKQTDVVEGFADAKSVEANQKMIEYHCLRSCYVDHICSVLAILGKDVNDRVLPDAQLMISNLVKTIQESPAGDLEQVKALLEDAAGQTTEALSKAEWTRKWGRHYLPSIMFAHKTQQCNNFKDPGVQVYGGDIFHDIQERADELFNTIPAPQPRAVNRPPVGARGGYNAGGYVAPAPVSMAAYNNRYGGCIDTACTVRLACGATRRIGELAKGDIVRALDGATAEVVCLVRTTCAGSRASLVELPGGCRLTPFHPVRSDGGWVFPADLAGAKELQCEAVCSLVLKGSPALVVDGVPCVALGHGLTEGAAKHAFWGTDAVLKDLACAPGFAQGLVELTADSIVRDAANGQVCGLRF